MHSVSVNLWGFKRDTSPVFHLWHACPKSIFTIHKCFCLAKKDEMSTVLLESAYLSNQLQLSDFTGHAVEATSHLETVTCLVMAVTAICFPNNAWTTLASTKVLKGHEASHGIFRVAGNYPPSALCSATFCRGPGCILFFFISDLLLLLLFFF